MKKAFIIGCGGTGSWVALIAYKSKKYDKLILIDGDVVEQRNLGRMLYENVGRKKTHELRALLSRYNDHEENRTIIDEYSDYIEKNLENLKNLVLLYQEEENNFMDFYVCVDDLLLQRNLFVYLKNEKHTNKYNYIGVGYGVDTLGDVKLRVSDAIPLLINNGETLDAEELVAYENPVGIIPTILSAGLAVYSLLYKIDLHIMGNINRICLQDDPFIPLRYCINKIKRLIKDEDEEIHKIIVEEGYNKCIDCDRQQDCNDCDRGFCEDCGRVSEDDLIDANNRIDELENEALDLSQNVEKLEEEIKDLKEDKNKLSIEIENLKGIEEKSKDA